MSPETSETVLSACKELNSFKLVSFCVELPLIFRGSNYPSFSLEVLTGLIDKLGGHKLIFQK